MEKKIVNILGLGQSLKEYKPNGGITIGVNDITTFVDIDYLVIQDKPHAFSFNRYQQIIDNPPKKYVFSYQTEWQQDFAKEDNNIFLHLPQKITTGLDSTYLAVKIARIYFNASQINLYGVDFTNHPQHSKILPKILKQYEQIAEVLSDLNIKLCCTNTSALKDIKNIHPIEN